MEEIIKRYEALTSEQKEMCKGGFKWAYENVLTILKKDEEKLDKMKRSIKNMEDLENDLNEDLEISKKRKLLYEQLKELAELEIELKWTLPLLTTMD